LVKGFIKLNKEVLLDYWNQQIYTEDLFDKIKPLSPKMKYTKTGVQK